MADAPKSPLDGIKASMEAAARHDREPDGNPVIRISGSGIEVVLAEFLADLRAELRPYNRCLAEIENRLAALERAIKSGGE